MFGIFSVSEAGGAGFGMSIHTHMVPYMLMQATGVWFDCCRLWIE